MAEQFLPVLITLLLAVITAAVLLGVAALLGSRSRQQTPGGRSTYESGVPVVDEAHKRIPVKFYLVALVFVVLDVEVAFLYPWAVTYRSLLATHSTTVLWDMLAFMALLALAYFYLWRTGVFDWGRPKQFAGRGGQR